MKMYSTILSALCLWLLLAPEAGAQYAKRVSGVVVDGLTSDPIRGAAVKISGQKSGTYTSAKGEFAIQVPPATPSQTTSLFIVVSAIGYTTDTIDINQRTTSSSDQLIVSLTPSTLMRDEVIVSASKRVQAVQDVPISVSIMKSEDIQQRGVVRLDDALRYVSGITVVKDQVNIRGASGFALGVGSRTAVLLDGFSLLSGDNGDIKFDILPVMDIERVEIIKGAGSALYGTGALGGVVSIQTKRPTKDLTVVARSYGGIYTGAPYERWNYLSSGYTSLSGADVRVAQRVGDFEYSVSAGVRNDQGYRAFDGALRGFGFAKASYDIDKQQSLKLNIFHAEDERQNYLYWKDLKNATLPSANQILDEYLLTNKTAAGIEYNNVLDDQNTLIARYGFFRTGLGYIYSSSSLPPDYSIANAHTVDLQHNGSLTDAMQLTSGLSARLNTVRSAIYGQTMQHIVSLFSQAEYKSEAGPVFTLGMRLDREETSTLTPHVVLSPKLGMSWPVSDDLSIRASTGRGFRAPTVAERYANVQYGPFKVKPNPSVQAEYSWSSEIGVNWKSREVLPIEIDVAVFDNELFSLIEPTFDLSSPEIPIIFTNLTRARIIGTEITARMAFGAGLLAETGLTLMDPRDMTLGTTLIFRNKMLWFSRASWTLLPWLEIQAEYRYQDRISQINDRLALFITDADVRVPVHVLDARVFAKIDRTWRLGLIGRNITNYAYVEAVGNLGPTRSVMLQLEYR
ncbi:MAG: TonB-dependent receptor [Ignavibacteria bacterium]|jgi:outer membrane receptor for ferrienterochelin and colicins